MPLFITQAEHQPLSHLMIHLQVQGKAVWILQITRRGVAKKPRPINDSYAVGRKGRDPLACILTKRAHVERYLVKEQAHATPHNCALRRRWQEYDSEARREVIPGTQLIA